MLGSVLNVLNAKCRQRQSLHGSRLKTSNSTATSAMNQSSHTLYRTGYRQVKVNNSSKLLKITLKITSSYTSIRHYNCNRSIQVFTTFLTVLPDNIKLHTRLEIN